MTKNEFSVDYADVSSVGTHPSEIARTSSTSPASHYIEQIKIFVKSRAVSTDELLEKLDQLSDLLRDEALLSKRTSDDTHTSWKHLRMCPSMTRKNEANQDSVYALKRPSRREDRGRINDASQYQQAELSSGSDSDDQDSSFARLSYLLEKTIHEGRDALASPAPSQRPNNTPHRAFHASPVTGSPLRSPLLTTRSARFFHSQTRDDDMNEPVHGQIAGQLTSDISDAGDVDASDQEYDGPLEEHHGNLAPPPAYAESRSALSRRSLVNAPHSLVDDGIAALESLIDQLTANTLSGRATSGLTSNNLLVVVSFFVLVVACIAANQYGTIGVNCHCTCPDLTTRR